MNRAENTKLMEQLAKASNANTERIIREIELHEITKELLGDNSAIAVIRAINENK